MEDLISLTDRVKCNELVIWWQLDKIIVKYFISIDENPRFLLEMISSSQKESFSGFPKLNHFLMLNYLLKYLSFTSFSFKYDIIFHGGTMILINGLWSLKSTEFYVIEIYI